MPCPSTCFIDGSCTRCPNLCSFEKNASRSDELESALTRLGIKFRISGRFVKLLNYPFVGAEFAVRTIGRYATVLPRNVKKKRRSLLKARAKIFPRFENYEE